jgi:NAD(P)-dependent dehydrogenase (short-subunit alcohol dehydrogenase family)
MGGPLVVAANGRWRPLPGARTANRRTKNELQERVGRDSTPQQAARGGPRGEGAYVCKRFSNKTALVTGAGSSGPGYGNGKAICIALAREGARVAVLDQDADRAAETHEIIQQEGGGSFPLTADVANNSDCREAVAEIARRYGGVDVLVNNVGIHGPHGNAVDVDPEQWDKAMEVNVKSVMLMSKWVVPAMVTRGAGAIINISSTAGMVGGNSALLYPTSKGAIINMTRAMAAHHGPAGVRVNCVAPGMLFTPRIEARGLSEEMREHRRMKSLLQTEGTAWDVANAVSFLASDDARWITGVTLPVDAGLTAGDLDNPLPEKAAE